MGFKNSIFLLNGIFDDSHKREMIKRISLNKENILNNLHLLLTQTGNRADIVFSSELPVLPKPGSLSRMQEGSRTRVDIHFFPQNLPDPFPYLRLKTLALVEALLEHLTYFLAFPTYFDSPPNSIII